MMIFPKIPTMKVKKNQIGEPSHYGAGNVVTIISDTSKEDYITYLKDLKEAGLEEYVVNEEGVGGTVFNAIYTMGKWVVTITYTQKTKKTYISTCFNLPLSKYLHYNGGYIDDKKIDAKTKLHMMEMWHYGNSFVIQLKNGHFLISDGGQKEDAPILVDYLENLTPKGEKPIVEAWFFTHGHGDHCGIMGQFFDDRSLCDRIYVEGFYYNEPSEEISQMNPATRIIDSWMRGVAGVIKTTEGTRPKVYRPQTGQRYYFCDITMDIVHGQEQLLKEDYSGDINESSTWCMLHIEGQKVLLTGDGEKGCMKMIMEHYTKEYLNVDVMTLMHHGFNTENKFTDFCNVKTLLLTVKDVLPVRKANENDYLKSKVQEWFAWGDGTKILEFPYEVGMYKTLPHAKWIYGGESDCRIQPNVYRYWPDHKNKEIRSLRIFENGWNKQGEYLLKKIYDRLPLQTTDDGMRIDLLVDNNIEDEIRICFEVPNGWKIIGREETLLDKAIDYALETAEWSDNGFVMHEFI